MAIDAITLSRLYTNERLSMAEIATRLRCSGSTVVYWMNEHRLSRRSRSQATEFKRNRIDPFILKESLTLEEDRLKSLALGLFLGEGNKRDITAVRLGNSDPLILRLFTRFLREVCGVDEKRLRLSLLVHPDLNIEETERFWSRQLLIPRSRFQKTVVLKPRGRGTYKHRCAFGVAQINFCSIALRRVIDRWLKELE